MKKFSRKMKPWPGFGAKDRLVWAPLALAHVSPSDGVVCHLPASAPTPLHPSSTPFPTTHARSQQTRSAGHSVESPWPGGHDTVVGSGL